MELVRPASGVAARARSLPADAGIDLVARPTHSAFPEYSITFTHTHSHTYTHTATMFSQAAKMALRRPAAASAAARSASLISKRGYAEAVEAGKIKLSLVLPHQVRFPSMHICAVCMLLLLTPCSLLCICARLLACAHLRRVCRCRPTTPFPPCWTGPALLHQLWGTDWLKTPLTRLDMHHAFIRVLYTRIAMTHRLAVVDTRLAMATDHSTDLI